MSPELSSDELLVVTSPSVEGWVTEKVFGLVTGEVIVAAGIFRDFAAGVSSVVGGNLEAYANVIRQARERALLALRAEAFARGANAVVSCDLDYETIEGGLMMVSASGTAVCIASEEGSGYEFNEPELDGLASETLCEKCGLMIPWHEPHCPNCATLRPE